jgi:hypothetical protein
MPEAQEYRAFFMNGEKIGYGGTSRIADANAVTTVNAEQATFALYGSPETMHSVAKSVETTEGEALGFEDVSHRVGTFLWVFKSEHLRRVVGKRNGEGTFDVTITSDGKSDHKTIDWAEGVVLDEGYRLLQQENGLKEGTAYSAKVFDAERLVVNDVEVVVGATEEVRLIDGAELLTELSKKTSGPSGTYEYVQFVDSDFNVRKTVMRIGGLEIEEIACSREVALGENGDVSLGDMVGLIRSPVALWSIPKTLEYHLVGKGANAISLPSTSYQAVESSPAGGLVVTVRAVELPEGAEFPYEGDEAVVLEAMVSTELLESDHELIMSLASKAVGDTTDAGKAARKIESFVSGYMRSWKTDMYAEAFPSAVEVAEHRSGMCRQYAVLTAALCRSAGIPAQIVTGYKYSGSHGGRSNVFVAHAWTQAYIGGEWVPLDSTVMSLWGLVRTHSAGYIATGISNGGREGSALGMQGLGMFEIESIKR